MCKIIYRRQTTAQHLNRQLPAQFFHSIVSLHFPSAQKEKLFVESLVLSHFVVRQVHSNSIFHGSLATEKWKRKKRRSNAKGEFKHIERLLTSASRTFLSFIRCWHSRLAQHLRLNSTTWKPIAVAQWTALFTSCTSALDVLNNVFLIIISLFNAKTLRLQRWTWLNCSNRLRSSTSREFA